MLGPLRGRTVCVRVLMLWALLLARALVTGMLMLGQIGRVGVGGVRLVSARVGLPLLVVASVRGIATRRVSMLMVCCSSVTVRLMVMVRAVVGVVRPQVLLALLVAAMTIVAGMAAVTEQQTNRRSKLTALRE